ncbi:5'/3'-nucleotidase SurE [Shigella flexneri]
MRILLSNDDGVHAPGIQTLAKACVSLLTYRGCPGS